MSVYTEAAKKIVRDKRESLKQLDPGKRLEVVQEIVGQLQTKSEDEVISFLSKGKQEGSLTPISMILIGRKTRKTQATMKILLQKN